VLLPKVIHTDCVTMKHDCRCLARFSSAEIMLKFLLTNCFDSGWLYLVAPPKQHPRLRRVHSLRSLRFVPIVVLEHSQVPFSPCAFGHLTLTATTFAEPLTSHRSANCFSSPRPLAIIVKAFRGDSGYELTYAPGLQRL
jgi:hypothetical protein